MKSALVVIVFLAFTGCGKETPVTDGPAAPEESAGADLRRMVLSTRPNELGFTSDADFPSVYGVLTEWDMDGVTATMMSMRDGTASLYTTSTFGIIGGHGHESVRKAAVRYVKAGQQLAKSGKPVIEFAYPESGQVFYYLLTYDGVRLVTGNRAAIEQGEDSTHPLFAAAQDVLTELRVITEETNAQERRDNASSVKD